MQLRTLITGSALAAGLLFSAIQAQAADSPRVGVRGAITSIQGDTLNLHTNQGEDMTVAVAANAQVRGVVKADIADIKPGSYIGTAAIPQPDGTQKALEVHVFPPAMAGAGEGHRAFDLTPGSTMTNGTVGDLMVRDGRTMTLSYKGGEQKVVVPPDVPIVNLVPADRSLLKPGVKVVVFVQKADDGTLTTQAILAGENGLTPPM